MTAGLRDLQTFAGSPLVGLAMGRVTHSLWTDLPDCDGVAVLLTCSLNAAITAAFAGAPAAARPVMSARQVRRRRSIAG